MHRGDTALSDRIDADRLWRRHLEFARFGALAGGGVDRQALSEAETEARATLVGWARAIGLEPFTDPAANLFLRLEGTDPTLPPVLVGSHIDSQPTGGWFDGVLGVLAGLEVAEAFRAAGVRPRRSIEVVAWMNEEGSRFAPGMMGSAAYTGARTLGAIRAITDSTGVTAGEGIDALLARDAGIAIRPLGRPAAAFVEAHIEQGPILELAGKPIGVVTGIQGKRTFRVTVAGEENHAGTAPRRVRRDALVSAVAIMTALQRETLDEADVTRFTIGRVEVLPNAPSVVPARVTFSVDLRHPDADELTRLGDLIAPTANAMRGPCEVEVRELLHDPPLAFPPEMQRLLSDAARHVGADWMSLPSGAGHDARYLHYFCPTGMIFIPCRNGVSHSKEEWADPSHVALAARVLVEAVTELSAG